MERFLQGVRFSQVTLNKAHSRCFTLGSLQGAPTRRALCSPVFGDILPDHKLRL